MDRLSQATGEGGSAPIEDAAAAPDPAITVIAPDGASFLTWLLFQSAM